MKKILAIILAVVLAISLFGCYNGNDPVGTTDPSTEATLGNHDHDHNHGDKTTGATNSTDATTDAPTEATTESTEAPTEATTEATEPSETEHKHTYTSVVFEPSCEAKGYTKHTCECGDSYVDNEKPATGHQYKTTTIAPTKDRQGYDLHTCGICGDSYKDNYTDKLPDETQPPETGHKHSYTTKVIAPTCTEKGYTKYTCSCGDSYTSDEKPATGHNYKTTTVAPTKDSQGYDLHTCNKCGHSYKDNYKDKLPSDDDHTGKYYDEGSGKWVEWNCASKGHRWGGEWSSKPPKTIREATCCQLKIVEYYCEVVGCNGSEQREIANSYTNHKRSVDTITGLEHKWRVRMSSGWSPTYESEEMMKTIVRGLVDEYKSGKRTDWVEYIEEYYTATFTDTYVCLECGQTLGNNSRYTWVGEPPYKGYTVSKVYYTKDNQPNF